MTNNKIGPEIGLKVVRSGRPFPSSKLHRGCPRCRTVLGSSRGGRAMREDSFVTQTKGPRPWLSCIHELEPVRVGLLLVFHFYCPTN
jgi:hypothetical protein